MKGITKKTSLIILLCLLSLAGNSLPLFAGSNADPFFFMQIADPQIGFNNRKTNKSFSDEIEHLEKAAEHINRLKPAFVVISGDMINNYDNQKQIQAFWQVASQIRSDVPLYFVGGNHDFEAANEKSVEVFRRTFGRDHYRFSYNGSEFIAINTSLIYSVCAEQGLKMAPKKLSESALQNDPAKELREAQRTWLEGELAYAQQKKPAHIFVLTHHPWFVNTPDEKDHYENIPLVYRMDYLGLMDRYGVDYTISGHCHAEKIRQYKNMQMVTSAALCKGNVGLRIFKVYPDKVEHTFYSLDKVPEKVEL